jgi:PhzF family phenazine biosynthesis protein
LRKVAAENNLPATAFLVPRGGAFELRWFTTRCEIRLCGHATLASGFVALERLNPGLQVASFHTKYGVLEVHRTGELLKMDFPALTPKHPSSAPQELVQALGLRFMPSEILEANDTWIAVLEERKAIIEAQPNSDLLAKLHPFAVAITAPGNSEDFVTRYFAPSYGIPEDSVTGSVHCVLTPYWSERLGKKTLRARQLSPRGGELLCEMAGERVHLSGKAFLTMEGTLTI